MTLQLFTSRLSAGGLLGASVALLAAYSASAPAIASAAMSSGEPGVVTVRRGSSAPGGGGGAVSAVRRAGAAETSAAQDREDAAGDRVGDHGGQRAGDRGDAKADPGQPDGSPELIATSETIVIPEIGVRGERVGRLLRIQGAEVVFADCGMLVSHGTALGHTGVMGSLLDTPGGTQPRLIFTLESGGDVTLTLQPLPGNRSSPNRPVHTLTLRVP